MAEAAALGGLDLGEGLARFWPRALRRKARLRRVAMLSGCSAMAPRSSAAAHAKRSASRRASSPPVHVRSGHSGF